MHVSAESDIPASQVAQSDQTGQGRTVQQFLKDVGLFFAAPFITLAWLALFPFIGLMLLVRNGRQALQHRKPAG
jgi:hypothetical protein